jgi:hypothetical protein
VEAQNPAIKRQTARHSRGMRAVCPETGVEVESRKPKAEQKFGGILLSA